MRKSWFSNLGVIMVLTLLIFNVNQGFAQCELNDGNNNPSTAPFYTGCSKVTSANDTDFVIVITPSNNYGAWTMDWGDGTSSSGASLTPPGNINHTYISVTGGTNFADTFFFTFTSGGCTITGTVLSGYPVTANIEVPGGLTQLTCAPGILTFVNNSNGASGLPVMPGTTFDWNWGDGTPIQNEDYTTAGSSISHQYDKYMVNCVTQVDLVANNPCNLSPSTNSQSPVLIYDVDDAAIAASATVLCYPDTVVNFANGSMFNCYAQGNTDQRYEYWNLGDHWGLGYDSIIDWRPSGPPLGTPAPNPIPIAFPGIGTYTVNMIDSNMCGQEPASIVIQIVPPPTADISSVDTVCEGETVTFQNLSTGGPNEFAWDFDKGAGFLTSGGGNRNQVYNNAGTYTIRLAVGIAGSNCVDTAEWILEVLDSPTAVIDFDNQSGCDSLTVQFSDSSQGAIVSWDWDFDNGNTSSVPNPPSEFYGFPSNFNVSLTVTNALNCSDTDTEVINVYQTPVPNFSPASVCVDELAQFIDSSTSATGDPIVSWVWNFGDGSPTSTAQNPVHTYTAFGTYDVGLFISTAHCSALDTIQVVAEELPVSSFSTDTTYGCSPLSVNFTNNSSANATSFFWEFGDGDTTSLSDPSHVFGNNFGLDTNYHVSLVAITTFGCKDTSDQPVLVYPNPLALFNDSALPINCTPAIVGFRNLSSNGAVSYLWDFGNGKTSTLVHPRDTFVNDTNILQTQFVTLIAYSANGCSDTTSRSFLIFPKPDGLADTTDSGCAPLIVQFPAVTNAVSYIWNFKDGAFSNAPAPLSHQFNTPGDYAVQLVTSSSVGCKDTSISLVRVHNLPGAQFNSNLFQACAPAEVEFTNLSTGATNYHWDYGDDHTLDTTGMLNSHLFTNTGVIDSIYDVTLTAENIHGCIDTFFSPITVYPQVFASFEHDSVGCSPFGVLFQNTSSATATAFGWFFGDGTGSSQKNPAKPYINNGLVPDSFIVSLVAASPRGCSDSVASMLIVYPQPNANFTLDPPTNTLTYPDTVFTINNLDLNWQAKWDFGDGTSSLDSIPGQKAYTSWGTWIIKLITYNEFCEDSASETVIINPPIPIPGFGDPEEGCEDLTVAFINKSKYANSYRWDFVNSQSGSKQSSVDENPEVIFTDPGTYNVTLSVTGDGGTDAITEFGYITVFEQPLADFTFAPDEVFIPNEPVVFNNNSRGDNLTYLWEFGDGESSNAENPEHYYKAEGEYLVTLTATNGSCEDVRKSLSPVRAIPSGGLSTPNAFTPNSGGDPGVNGAFDFGGGGLDIFANDVFYPKVVGEIKDYEFMIFNKWGEMLFRTTKSTVGWTGWYRSNLCQQDVYVYKVNATLIDNSEIVLVGDLTLLR